MKQTYLVTVDWPIRIERRGTYDFEKYIKDALINYWYSDENVAFDFAEDPEVQVKTEGARTVVIENVCLKEEIESLITQALGCKEFPPIHGDRQAKMLHRALALLNQMTVWG